jgi:hypothetical protein
MSFFRSCSGPFALLETPGSDPVETARLVFRRIPFPELAIQRIVLHRKVFFPL